jgi:hypothetical protein
MQKDIFKRLYEIGQARGLRGYDPSEWSKTSPERLYHTTSLPNLRSIIKEGGFYPKKSEERGFNDWVYLSASPTERLGSFILVFDGSEAIEMGFSPRTYLLDDEMNYREEIHIKTDKGMIVLEKMKGKIPSELWNKYQYPFQIEREIDDFLNVYGVISYAETLYPFNKRVIEPYQGTIRLNIGCLIGQTFVRKVKEKCRLPKVVSLLYDSRDVSEEVAIGLGYRLSLDKKKVMNIEGATKIYPEMLSKDQAYMQKVSLEGRFFSRTYKIE